MPRPERSVDPTDGPIAAFAHELRKLREQANNPLYSAMARQVHLAQSTLADAAGGERFPTWRTVEAYVTACGGDVAEWRPRWEEARRQTETKGASTPSVMPTQESSTPPDIPSTETPTLTSEPPQKPEPDAAPRPRRGDSIRNMGRSRVAIVGGTAVLTIAVLAFVLFGGHSAGRAEGSGTFSAEPTTSAISAVIKVQNKIALGADVLTEDSSPAYLSSQPRPYCARQGCKVDGTEMQSGATLRASCQLQGPQMWNYDVASDVAAQNPNAVTSTTWYRARLTSGAEGYLSEVYVEPGSRGGLGLPLCS